MAPLPPLFPCAWAVAHGEDRYGLWQAFEVAGVRQVMRWVPPGRFTMGSPVTEAERGGDETQHAVTLTAGFWLADSACSQALWAAVMDGANRSHFNHDPQNPVEQVSWHDAVGEFLPGLNSRVPGLAAGLPTEPRHADAAEGEGWLMGLVVDANRQTTDFVILDAQDITGPAVALVTIPHRIPAGFHGNWVPTQQRPG